MRVGVCALAIGLAALAVAQEHLFYGGDFNGINGLACERNTQVSDARTYDDVIVEKPALVSGIWGNHLTTGLVSSSAYWEVREGVLAGYGGRLVAFGEGRATYIDTRRSWQLTELQCFVAFDPPLLILPGRYWVTVCPIGDGRGRAYVSTTFGNDFGPIGDPNPAPAGKPRGNGNSYFDSPYFGYSWVDPSEVLGHDYEWDFSFGIGPFTRDRLPVEGFQVELGTLLIGGLDELASSDDTRLKVRRVRPADLSTPNVRIVWEARAASDVIDDLRFTIESMVDNVPANRTRVTVDLFDFRARRWERLAAGPAHDQDRTIDAFAKGDAQRFVEPGTRRMLARTSWEDRGGLYDPWGAWVDFVQWQAGRVE